MAGNEQIFDSIVDPAANKQVQDLTKDLADLDKQAVDTAKSVNVLNSAIANSKTFSELKKQSDAVEKSQKQAQDALEKTRVKEVKLQEERERIAAKRKKIVSESTASEVAQANAVNSNTNAVRSNTQAINQNLQSELQAEQAAARYKAARITNTVATTEETAAVVANTAAQGANSSSLANVGKSLTRGLSSLRTLAYILPGIGIAGIFNIAIEGLTALYDKLTAGGEKFDTFKSRIKDLSNALASTEYTTAITNVQQLSTEIDLAKKGFISKDEVVKHYNETIGKTTGLVSSLDEAEKELGKNANNYIQFTLLKAAANIALQEAAQKAYSAEQTRLKQLAEFQTVTDPFNSFGQGLNEQNYKSATEKTKRLQQERKDAAIKIDTDAANAQINIAKKFNEDAAKIALNNNFNFFQDNSKGGKSKKDNTYAQLLQQQKEILDSVVQYEKSTFDDRLMALKAFEGASKILIDKGVKSKEFTELEGNTKLLNLTNEVNKGRIKINQDAQKALSILMKDGLKGQEDAERASIEVIQKAGDDRVLAIENNAATAESALADQYAKGIITQKQYQSQLTAIEDQSAIDRLDQEIITTQAIIDLRKGLLTFGIGSAKELQTAEDKLAAQKLARIKAGTKAVLDGVKDEAQAREQLHQSEQRLGEASIQLIQTVVDAGYARQLQALQDLSAQVDDNASKEKEANNSTLQSAKDKADKNAVIDARTAAQKEQIAGREKQLKRQQAEFDRAVSIARIIEETAIAVVHALAIPIGGFALAAVVGALGAVQLATVLATPLPAFEKGGVTPGGNIIWGEKGVELATEPSGKQYLSPASATVANMPKGTLITPHLELMGMLRPDKVNYVGGQEVPWKSVIAAIERNKPNKKAPVTKIYVDNQHADIRRKYFR